MKTIVITGAANGVGKEIAHLLKGENLILIDEKSGAAKKTAQEVGGEAYGCDLTKPKQIEAVVSDILKKHKKIDCLINCAGVWCAGALSEMNQEEFQQVNSLTHIQKTIDTNLFGSIAMIKSFYPIFEKQKKGQIINIVSQAAVETESYCPVYEASKKGAYAFRKSTQQDLAQHNIKITDICPGLIKTNFFKRAGTPLPKETMKTGLDPEEVAKAVKYVLDLPHEITIPSLEIRHIKNY